MRKMKTAGIGAAGTIGLAVFVASFFGGDEVPDAIEVLPAAVMVAGSHEFNAIGVACNVQPAEDDEEGRIAVVMTVLVDSAAVHDSLAYDVYLTVLGRFEQEGSRFEREYQFTGNLDSGPDVPIPAGGPPYTVMITVDPHVVSGDTIRGNNTADGQCR